MRVVRGRAATIGADREVTAILRDDVAGTGEPAVRAWTPHRQVAFGRRDAAADGYRRAREAAETRGFPPVERSVGGRAVAHTGTTVAFVRVDPVDDPRRGLDGRYESAVAALDGALAGLGVDVERGEPPDAFCPGDHSLSAGGGKIAGIAQRVGGRSALTAGVVVVRDRDEIAGVLGPVYEALEVPFDPGGVGSVTAAGGPDDPATVAGAVEDALVGDRERRVEHLG